MRASVPGGITKQSDGVMESVSRLMRARSAGRGSGIQRVRTAVQSAVQRCLQCVRRGSCSDRPRTAAGVRDELGLGLPGEAIDEIFLEFGRRGLMFLDGSLAVALALPAVPAR
jgi:hypothetical protein